MTTLQIREETGIETKFRSIVAFRHGHNFNFGCSDIYIVVALRPLSETIHADKKEIAKCQWMPLKVTFLTLFINSKLLNLVHGQTNLAGVRSSSTCARDQPAFCGKIPRVARFRRIDWSHRDRASHQGLCETTNHLQCKTDKIAQRANKLDSHYR